MQKLLISRRAKQQPQEVLQNLQPEKYGKGAYCDMSYTPSKLADHILFKDANFLKKLEEQASKNRALEAKNKTLGDQVDYLKRQRDGIEASLKKMIEMYKGIMSEMEARSDERAKFYQQKFKSQLEKVIKDKAEEARYVQSEKQILEGRILELESVIEKQKQQIRLLSRNKSQLHKALDELTIEHKHLNEKHDTLKERYDEKCQQAKQQYDTLKKEYMNAEVQWKNTLNQELHKKDLQNEKNQKIHATQMQKEVAQRKHEINQKNQEIIDLTNTFDSETGRMQQIILIKDKMIDTLTADNHREKSRVLALTRQYQSQISQLNHQKNRLLDEIDLYAHDNEGLIRQKALITEDLEKQNLNLRDLLFESSVELEKCKSELVSLARDNTKLLTRVKSSQEEAKTWRDSYYISKNRPS